MKIPIQNLYYLLCYAWDKLDERDIVAVDAAGSTALADLFARVLINGSNHLIKRGFDRGYVAHREWTARLRGRICFDEAIRSNSLRMGRLPCEFDDLSHDILHNRILKSTLRRLLRAEGLDRKLAESLSVLCRRFDDIQEIELTNRVFGRVQLHRNNQFYDFLLKVCGLIHRNLLISERSGTGRFMDFVQDEHQMRQLYEGFVRTFYQTHTEYRVKREDIVWRWSSLDPFSQALLPKMQTDISLTSPDRKIIIDCKFTPKATQQHYESSKLRSEHLYQINAYLNNLPPGRLTDACEIMLLYPTVDTPLSASFLDDKRRRISIRTINLNQDWQLIHADLLALVA